VTHIADALPVSFSRGLIVASSVALFAFLVSIPAGATALPLSAALIKPTGNMTLSPSGPIIDPNAPQLWGAPSTLPHNLSTDSYTYLRCWHRLDASLLKPKAAYEWAQEPGGDWYRVPGYWRDDGIFEWRNMFYSNVTQDTLLNVCRKTLDAQGIKQPVTQAMAANNQLSFNYTVWTLDAAQQDQRINKLIVFGDSLSDTQNAFNASEWKLPNEESWYAGRFSNGPVWVEYLAASLKLPMYNWAIGGAGTDQHLVLPGVLQQVESWQQYMERASNYRPENTLFLMFAGSNDFINYGRTPEAANQAMQDSLAALITAGAKRVMVVNLPDVSRTPAFLQRSDTAYVAGQVKVYNALLQRTVQALQNQYGAALQIELFDTHALFDDLLSHPAAYGFDEVQHACLSDVSASALSYASAKVPSPNCVDPGRYVFWDALHPTTRTHEWMAQRVTAFVRQRFAALMPTRLLGREGVAQRPQLLPERVLDGRLP